MATNSKQPTVTMATGSSFEKAKNTVGPQKYFDIFLNKKISTQSTILNSKTHWDNLRK